VDYARRWSALAELQSMSPVGDKSEVVMDTLLMHLDHDSLKLAVIRAALRALTAHAPLFANGSYHPLAAHGARGDRIVAFERRSVASTLDDAAIIVVPRLTHSFAPNAPPIGDVWRDTELHLNAEQHAATRWRCAISDLEIAFPNASEKTVRVAISDILAVAPVAILLPVRDPSRDPTRSSP